MLQIRRSASRSKLYHEISSGTMPGGPQSVSGDPKLPGFVLDLRPVWEP